VGSGHVSRCWPRWLATFVAYYTLRCTSKYRTESGVSIVRLVTELLDMESRESSPKRDSVRLRFALPGRSRAWLHAAEGAKEVHDSRRPESLSAAWSSLRS
jgi:hypothetical protein